MFCPDLCDHIINILELHTSYMITNSVYLFWQCHSVFGRKIQQFMRPKTGKTAFATQPMTDDRPNRPKLNSKLHPQPFREATPNVKQTGWFCTKCYNNNTNSTSPSLSPGVVANSSTAALRREFSRTESRYSESPIEVWVDCLPE